MTKLYCGTGSCGECGACRRHAALLRSIRLKYAERFLEKARGCYGLSCSQLAFRTHLLIKQLRGQSLNLLERRIGAIPNDHVQWILDEAA